MRTDTYPSGTVVTGDSKVAVITKPIHRYQVDLYETNADYVYKHNRADVRFFWYYRNALTWAREAAE